jgi:hypothetical protein
LVDRGRQFLAKAGRNCVRVAKFRDVAANPLRLPDVRHGSSRGPQIVDLQELFIWFGDPACSRRMRSRVAPWCPLSAFHEDLLAGWAVPTALTEVERIPTKAIAQAASAQTITAPEGRSRMAESPRPIP